MSFYDLYMSQLHFGGGGWKEEGLEVFKVNTLCLDGNHTLLLLHTLVNITHKKETQLKHIKLELFCINPASDRYSPVPNIQECSVCFPQPHFV